MITIYLKQNNKIIRNAELELFDRLGFDDILWIDMLTPSMKEQKAVEDYLDIDLLSRQQAEEIESSSKYSETENSVIANSNFFVPKTDSFDIEPVSFIITQGLLVTVRNAELRTFNEMSKKLQINYKAYPTGYHLFVSLLEVRIDYDADLVEAEARKISGLSKLLGDEVPSNEKLSKKINDIQESMMMIRESIFDRQRVLSGVLRSEEFPADVYPRLQLMMRDVSSLLSHADFSFERLDYLKDTVMGLINIEQNKTTKIFTVASVFFMPATLIASIYGMNVLLPWQHETGLWPFWITVIFMVVASGATIGFFRYKKWL
ncbi:MAG: magnesium and cobalt transport protein CorA [Rikenellaceae bacterium]|jgi:magnesium transporter|nr:magnesium and cobalt transport protein CorA [Rikenellaceae bacterium]